jgi:hypothetical protein
VRTLVTGAVGFAVTLVILALWRPTWEQLAEFFILWAAPGQVAFVLLYGLFSPWWLNRLGRALLTKSAALATVLSMIFVAYYFEVPIARWAAACVYGLTFVGVYWQFFAFLELRFKAGAGGEQQGIVPRLWRRVKTRSDA